MSSLCLLHATRSHGEPLGWFVQWAHEGSANHMLHQGTPHPQAQTHDEQRSHMCLVSQLPNFEKDKRWKSRPQRHLLKGFNNINKDYGKNIVYGFQTIPCRFLKASRHRGVGEV